ALCVLVAAIGLAVESVREILTPHHGPAPFTLGILVVVIVIKEILFRYVNRIGEDLESTAVQTDAWHHRSDALTSAAAFIGISVALVGGEPWQSADDWAALFACAVIAANGIRLARPACSCTSSRRGDRLLSSSSSKEIGRDRGRGGVRGRPYIVRTTSTSASAKVFRARAILVAN